MSLSIQTTNNQTTNNQTTNNQTTNNQTYPDNFITQEPNHYNILQNTDCAEYQDKSCNQGSPQLHKSNTQST